MTSRRSRRLDRQRDRVGAEGYEQERRRYLLYAIIALLVPVIDLLTIDLLNFAISFPIAVLISIYFFRAAIRIAPSPTREPELSTEPPGATPYEQSLQKRMKQGRSSSR